MNFFEDFKREVEVDLRKLGITPQPNASLEDVLLLRYTYMRKTIRARPRNIFQSREFATALLGCNPAEQAAMNDIIAKFVRGDDVNGHLSRASLNPQRADGMLFDWDVYHLHVSNTNSNPGQPFFDRTGPVALFRCVGDEVYFIDIRPHGASNPLLWTQTDILEIIDQNWPSLLDPFTVGLSTAYNPTAVELQQLRGNSRTGQGAVVPMLQIGNRVIAVPGGGMATSGTSTAVMERVDSSLYLIKDLENFLKEHGQAIKIEIEPTVGVPAAKQDFKLARNQGFWVIIENTSGQPLLIKELQQALANLPAAA